MIIFAALQERDSMETVDQLKVVLGEIDAMSTGTTHKILILQTFCLAYKSCSYKRRRAIFEANYTTT